MANAPFKTDPVRTAIALAYSNEQYIADMVLPRAMVSSEEFLWTLYNKADGFTVPDTTIDRKGRFNQVEFGGTEKASQTIDRGLEDVVPQKDIDRARDQNLQFDPVGNATELITELLLLDREIRVKNIVQDADLYPAGNKETLSAADRWDTETGDPMTQLSDAMETTWLRPNVMVLSSQTALAIQRNTKVGQAYNGTDGPEAMVPLEWIRQTLGLDQILVGRSRQNTAKKGQPETYARVWDNKVTLIYRNPAALPNKGLTFGITAEYGSRIAMTKRDEDVGMRGATAVRVGESTREIIMAADCGYLIESVIG